MSGGAVRRPFFSVLITAYNRQRQIERSVASATRQTFDDLEIVVVDDGSTDATASILGAIEEPRMRVITHPSNRGISPARATAVAHARGEWMVMVDSDWELLPHSLERLRTIIAELPDGVRMIRSALVWDDGTVTPSILPETPVTDYQGRLRWLEQVWVAGASSDAGHCIHRAVFEHGTFPDRRGGIEALWETDVARTEPSFWVSEVLGVQHVDADNSTTRAATIERLLLEAPDMLWMAETMLARHGDDLARHAPYYRAWLLGTAAQEALMAGRRGPGLRYARAARRAGTGQLEWITLALGLIDRRALAYAKMAGRRWRGRSLVRRQEERDGA